MLDTPSAGTMRRLGEVTLTGKNQITLPAAGVREIGLTQGDHLLVWLVGPDAFFLMRRPENWTEAFAGRLDHVFGDHAENLRYLDEQRAGWEAEA